MANGNRNTGNSNISGSDASSPETTNSTASNVEGATIETGGGGTQGNAKTRANTKTAQESVEAAEKEIKKLSVGDKLEVVGPYDPNSLAQVFRFSRLNDKKEPIDILPGQTLKVGGNEGDITKAEAEILLRNEQWQFKRK